MTASSNVAPVAEASGEGGSAEKATHRADEEDETAMEGARAVPAPHSESVGQLESWKQIGWRTHHTELDARHVCEQGALLITSGWQLNKIM